MPAPPADLERNQFHFSTNQKGEIPSSKLLGDVGEQTIKSEEEVEG